MAGYISFVTATTTAPTLPSLSIGIQPVTYQMQLTKIEAFVSGTYSATGAPPALSIYKYLGGSFSGGSTLAARPLRDGTASTVFTIKSGATVSGTAAQLSTQFLSSGSLVTYQFAFDEICAPGVSVFYVTVGGGGAASGIYVASLTVQFQELHLARSN